MSYSTACSHPGRAVAVLPCLCAGGMTLGQSYDGELTGWASLQSQRASLPGGDSATSSVPPAWRLGFACV